MKSELGRKKGKDLKMYKTRKREEQEKCKKRKIKTETQIERKERVIDY